MTKTAMQLGREGIGGRPEVKPHQCQQCLKSFSSNHQLVQHIRSVTVTLMSVQLQSVTFLFAEFTRGRSRTNVHIVIEDSSNCLTYNSTLGSTQVSPVSSRVFCLE